MRRARFGLSAIGWIAAVGVGWLVVGENRQPWNTVIGVLELVVLVVVLGILAFQPFGSRG